MRWIGDNIDDWTRARTEYSGLGMLTDDSFAEAFYELLAPVEKEDLFEIADARGWTILETFQSGWLPDWVDEDAARDADREDLEKALRQFYEYQ